MNTIIRNYRQLTRKQWENTLQVDVGDGYVIADTFTDKALKSGSHNNVVPNIDNFLCSPKRVDLFS